MKTTISLFLLTMLASSSLSLRAQQSKSSTAQIGDKTRMEIFKIWEGKWIGEGSMQQHPNSTPATFSIEEQIQYKLDGMVLSIEGIGKAKQPDGTEKVAHNAWGILSFDKLTDSYRFKTYLADGKSSDTWFTILSEGKYQWGFDVPSGKVQYSITVDPVKNTWNEIGSYSADGSTWYKFFEMNLRRQL